MNGRVLVLRITELFEECAHPIETIRLAARTDFVHGSQQLLLRLREVHCILAVRDLAAQ